MLGAMEKCREYLQGLTQETFSADSKTVDAVVRNFIVIGEAAAQVPKSVRERTKKVPWGTVIGIRNFVVPEYFGVSEEVLWRTVHDDLPGLELSIRELIEKADALA